MKIVLPLLLLALSFTACLNKKGVSLHYYSDCKEYYDLQGYYHKECGKNNLINYDEMQEVFQEKKEQPKGNIY
jgi:hypothetical protein